MFLICPFPLVVRSDPALLQFLQQDGEARGAEHPALNVCWTQGLFYICLDK